MAAKQGNSTMHFGHDDVTKSHGEVTPPWLLPTNRARVGIASWRDDQGHTSVTVGKQMDDGC